MAILELTHSFGDQEEFDVTLTPTDVDGNPTDKLGSGIVWASSDEAVAKVSASADGLTGTVKSTGQDGTCDVTATISDPDPEETGEESIAIVVHLTATEQSVSGMGATISPNRPRDSGPGPVARKKAKR